MEFQGSLRKQQQFEAGREKEDDAHIADEESVRIKRGINGPDMASEEANAASQLGEQETRLLPGRNAVTQCQSDDF